MEKLKQLINNWRTTFEASHKADKWWLPNLNLRKAENSQTEIDTIMHTLEDKLERHDKKPGFLRWLYSIFTPIEKQRKLLLYFRLTTLEKHITEMSGNHSIRGESDMMTMGTSLALSMRPLFKPALRTFEKKLPSVYKELRENTVFIEAVNADISDFRNELQKQTNKITDTINASISEEGTVDSHLNALVAANFSATVAFDFYSDKYRTLLKGLPENQASNYTIVDSVIHKFASLYRGFKKTFNTACDYLTNPERAIVLSDNQETHKETVETEEMDFNSGFEELRDFVHTETDRLRVVYEDKESDESDKAQAKDKALKELNRRFKILAKLCHPDRKGSNEAMAELNTLYGEFETFFKEDKFLSPNENILIRIFNTLNKMGRLFDELYDDLDRIARKEDEHTEKLRDFYESMFGPEETPDTVETVTETAIEPEQLRRVDRTNRNLERAFDDRDKMYKKLKGKLDEQHEQHKIDLEQQKRDLEQQKRDLEQQKRDLSTQEEIIRRQQEAMERLLARIEASKNTSNNSNTTNNTTNSNEDQGENKPSCSISYF